MLKNPILALRLMRKRWIYAGAYIEEVIIQHHPRTKEQFEQHIRDRAEVDRFLARCSVPIKEQRA